MRPRHPQRANNLAGVLYLERENRISNVALIQRGENCVGLKKQAEIGV